VRGWIPVVLACAGCRETAPPRDGARPPERSSATIPTPSASAGHTAPPSVPSSDWTAADKQPTTTEEMRTFAGHWRVTGSTLKLFAYQYGPFTLMFEVEADTADYRKGEIRFELDMALNGTGFSVREHARPDPGSKAYTDEGLAWCRHKTTTVGSVAMYEYLSAKVVDANTLRVQHVNVTTDFELGSDGRIVGCVNERETGEVWDELRREK
jgi:hypothetical protein